MDAALALFCMAAVLAVAQWAQPAATGARTWLWLGGACAGIAGGIKFHGLVVAAALGGVVLIRSLCLAAPDRAKALRRDLLPLWSGPYLPYCIWLAVPLVLTWLAVESPLFQPTLSTVSLDGTTWWLVLGLALIPAGVRELSKWARRNVSSRGELPRR